MQTIIRVENRLYQVPLTQPLGDASHEKHTHFELVMCIVTTEDGCTGYGYTYTGGIGGTAIVELLDRDVTPALLGRDAACIEGIWSDLRRRLHYVGRGGIDAFAISAADIALWDIRCKRANLPLWKMVGGANGRARAYAGGIDLDFSQEELLDNIRSYLRQRHTAVKIKLGKDTVAEDAARVAAVRELIGPDAHGGRQLQMDRGERPARVPGHRALPAPVDGGTRRSRRSGRLPPYDAAGGHRRRRRRELSFRI